MLPTVWLLHSSSVTRVIIAWTTQGHSIVRGWSLPGSDISGIVVCYLASSSALGSLPSSLGIQEYAGVLVEHARFLWAQEAPHPPRVYSVGAVTHAKV
eukprot:COSAG02_NODE_31447_length_533_cov_1.013825_1_plen_97_part_10